MYVSLYIYSTHTRTHTHTREIIHTYSLYTHIVLDCREYRHKLIVTIELLIASFSLLKSDSFRLKSIGENK